MNKEKFIEMCNKINITLNDEKIKKFEKYKDLLKEWNKKFNLTTIIEDEDIYLKHFYDSILVTKSANFDNKSICDIGTGAGFPGIVLAILFDDSKITLLESNAKKVTFLECVKKELNLNNVKIINDRAELYGKNNRELFDIVTCRAVARLKIIIELSAALLKINGLFIPMKSKVEDEIIESNMICNNVGYKLIDKLEYDLPIENSSRTILIYKKISKTDSKYPRNYNIIKSNK